MPRCKCKVARCHLTRTLKLSVLVLAMAGIQRLTVPCNWRSLTGFGGGENSLLRFTGYPLPFSPQWPQIYVVYNV